MFSESTYLGAPGAQEVTTIPALQELVGNDQVSMTWHTTLEPKSRLKLRVLGVQRRDLSPQIEMGKALWGWSPLR